MHAIHKKYLQNVFKGSESQISVAMTIYKESKKINVVLPQISANRLFLILNSAVEFLLINQRLRNLPQSGYREKFEWVRLLDLDIFL